LKRASMGARRWLRVAALAGSFALQGASAAAQSQEHESLRHETAAAEHGAEGEHEHHQDFNWFHGIIGARPGVEPNLLWRAPGTPPPFLAQLFNAALFFWLVARFSREPIARGLKERRDRIQRGIEEAAKMRAEAQRALDGYRQKIQNLDAEIERVRREMREGAEAERRRVLEDAAARRLRLEQDARVLIERELDALKEQLTRETASAALRSAREILLQGVSTEDHRRLCDEYLQNLSGESPARKVAGSFSSGNGAVERSEAT
jgi:F-type H+-transporting ATPase subunit b